MTPATPAMLKAPAIGDEMVFKPSPALSVGVELELQILNSRDGNLARDAEDLIRLVEKNGYPGAVKPETTKSMIEINSSIHHGHESLARYLLTERPHLPSPEVYELYNHNRFQACRYGVASTLVDAYSKRQTSLREEMSRNL